jgi:hypothetical protein
VLERILDVEGGSVAAGDQPRRHQIDDDAEQRRAQNEAAGHLGWMNQAADALVEEPGGQEPQSDAVRLRGEDLHPLTSIREVLVAGRAASRAAIRARAMADSRTRRR